MYLICCLYESKSGNYSINPILYSSCFKLQFARPVRKKFRKRTGLKEAKRAPPCSCRTAGKLEIEITHEGSRSEGSVSRLFYRYTEIPPVFERINIEGHRF